MTRKIIRDENECRKAMDALYMELIHANSYYRLHMDLSVALSSQQSKLLAHGHLYWQLALRAYLDNAVLRLCRVYDQNPRNVTLLCLIEFSASQPEVFSTAAYARRIGDRRDRDEPIKRHHPISNDERTRHRQWVEEGNNPIIKNLMMWRHKVIAHKDPVTSLHNPAWITKYPLKKNDIKH